MPGSTGNTRFRSIVIGHLRRNQWHLTWAALCLIGATLTQVLAPWPLKLVIDYVLLEEPLPASLSFLSGLFDHGPGFALLVISFSIAMIAILNGSFSYIQIYTTTKIGYQLVHLIRSELFSHLQRLPLAFHKQARSGEILTKFSGDTSTLREAFTEWTLTLLAQILTVVGMFVIMLWLNWQLSMVVLATIPTLLGILWYLNRKIISSVKTQRKQEGQITSKMNEILASISLVQAFGREEHEAGRFDHQSSQNLETSVRASRTSAAVTKAVAFVSAIGTAGTVFVGSWQVLKGHMSPGDLLVFISYLRNLYKPVKDIGSLSAKISRASVSANRIAELLNVEPGIPDRDEGFVAEHLKGDIAFHEVSFGYNPQERVLDQVSFNITRGQRVAFVGESGTGKSTIMNLILRLYTCQKGTIKIDGINVNQYHLESLRGQIGIVLQDAILFGASINENISYGKPDATPEEVVDAAKQAYAHDFISSLPEGYDTILSERGATLSGGQRQRVCLARALIKQPSILILDEPTSAIDPISATCIRDAIDRIQLGKTTLFISHQLSDMSQFDQILVLKDGDIIEHGSHDLLLQMKGHYHELVCQKSE